MFPEFMAFLPEIALTILLIVVPVFFYIRSLKANYTLVQQRNILVDVIMLEHRLWHKCQGPLYIHLENGHIQHMRGGSDGSPESR
jgi:hypothetical protein